MKTEDIDHGVATQHTCSEIKDQISWGQKDQVKAKGIAALTMS